MIITYLGEQFFKIARGDSVFAFNPPSKNSGSDASARFGADVAFVSVNHPFFNGVDRLSYGERMPFVMNSPGDYEVKGIFIKGVMSEAVIGGKKYINTIYSFALEGVDMVFLGALSGAEISNEARESLDSPDVVFVPIGGKNSERGIELLDAKMAAKLVSELEPKLVIPMSHDSDSLKVFLKEIGDEDAPSADKLALRPKDLEGKEGDVFVLKPA